MLLTGKQHVLACAFLLGMAAASHADIISYWRFEENTSGSANEFVNPNEISGEPDMVMTPNTPGSYADGADQYTNVPVNPIPDNGYTNDYAVGPVSSGSAQDGIYGIASYSSTLDIENMTVEFYFRTGETEAEFVARTGTPSSATPGAAISDGFRTGLKQGGGGTVQVLYHTNDGSTTTQVELVSSSSWNDSQWHHFAFTYDDTTGVGKLYVDGILQDEFDGDDGEDLFWTNTPEVYLGYRMDGSLNTWNNGKGLLDELRWSNEVLSPHDFLNAPEPGTVIAGGMLLLLAGGWELRRRRQKSAVAGGDGA